MSKERYKKNRARVFEIMGIKTNDPRYDCHHIVQRSDVRRYSCFRNFDLDQISNLYPILKTDHHRLNEMIAGREQPSIVKKKRKRVKYKNRKGRRKRR